MEKTLKFSDMTFEEKSKDLENIIHTMLVFNVLREDSLGSKEELMDIYEKSQGKPITIIELIARNFMLKNMEKRK